MIPLKRIFLSLVLLGGCALIVLFLADTARRTTHGFAAYYTASKILIDRPEELPRAYEDDWFAKQISEQGFRGIYDVFEFQPPTTALILTPLAGLDPLGARAVWTGLNVIFLGCGLLLLLRGLGIADKHLLWILPLSFVFTPLLDNFRYTQGYLMLFLLECVMIWGILTGHETIAGIGLGLMGILKTAALWIWPFFFVSRLWRPLKAAVTSILLVFFLSLIWAGPSPWGAYLSRLPELLVVPKRYVSAYQTVTSLTGHLLVFDRKWNPEPIIDLPSVASILNLLILGVTFLISLKYVRLRDAPLERKAISLGIITSVMIAVAPLAEGYHYTLVLPPLVVAAWWGWREKARFFTWVLLAMAGFLLAAPFPYRSDTIAGGWLAILAYPRVYGAYLLWAWFLLQAARPSSHAEDLSNIDRTDPAEEVAFEAEL